MEELKKVDEIADFINDSTELRCYAPSPNGGMSSEWFAELEYQSPLGEDVIECVFFDGTAKSFVDGIVELNNRYREHCEENIKRNINCGHTMRELVDDADAKAEIFGKFTNDVLEHYRQTYENV